jgi:hypothetical protein
MKDNIKAILQREIAGKYTYRENGDEILIYYIDYLYSPVYQIIYCGIGGYERGLPALIADFGSLDNNVLAFAMSYGLSNSRKDDWMSNLYSEAIAFRNIEPESEEEIIRFLGLAGIVQDYLNKNSDVIVEHKDGDEDNDLVLIHYRKENFIGFIAIDDINTWKYYMDIIKIVSSKTFIEKFLSFYGLDISTEFFIRLVSFLSSSSSTKVKQI